MFARCFLAAVLFFQLTLALEAQMMQQRGNQIVPGQQPRIQNQGMAGMQMQGMPFEASGTIDAIISPTRIQMTDSDGNKRLIALNNQTVVKTTGEATADFLKPGLCLEFMIEVDAKGIAASKVEELSIVTVSKDRPAGIVREGAESGVKAGGLKAAGEAKKKTPSTPVMSKIVGHIKSVKNGKYQLLAGKSNVLFELSESPKISIDVNDGTLAAKGDKIEVKGVMIPTMPNLGQAQSVTITLAETLGEKKKGDAKGDLKHPPKKNKSKKGDKSEGLPAPAEK